MDVDEDGRDDIIFAMFNAKYFTDVMRQDTVAKMKKLCLDNGKIHTIICIIIVIIINFYGAYILKNLSSEAQQNRIIKHNFGQGCTKVIRTRDNQRFMVEMQSEKARLSKLSFVLGTISCEICDLNCLGIF